MTLASGEHDDVEFGELLKVAIGGDEAPAGGGGERCEVRVHPQLW